MPENKQQHPLGILKASNSKPNAKKSIHWDESNLINTDLERKLCSTQKITEPKTPFIHSIPLSDYSGCSSSGPEDDENEGEEEEGESRRKNKTNFPFELTPGAVETIPSTPDRQEDHSLCQQVNQIDNQSTELAEQHKSFARKRTVHYHDMKSSIEIAKSLLHSNSNNNNYSED